MRLGGGNQTSSENRKARKDSNQCDECLCISPVTEEPTQKAKVCTSHILFMPILLFGNFEPHLSSSKLLLT